MLLLLFSGDIGGGGLPIVPANVHLQFLPAAAQFQPTAFPQYVRTAGSQFPVVGLAYDATVDEAAFWTFIADHFGSGQVTLDLYWYADTATSASVMWMAQLAAITADADPQDIETKALAAPSFMQDTHLGTVGQRLHKASMSLGQLDGLAAGDWCQLRVARDADGTFGTDDLAGDVILVLAEISYSDS